MSDLSRNLASERERRRQGRIRQLLEERDARERAVLARIPRLADLRRAQGEIGLELSRLALGRRPEDGAAAAALVERGRALQQEWEALLAAQGVEPRELTVWWDCPACQNTGWLLPGPEDARDGLVAPPKKCGCLLQEEIDDQFTGSGLTRPMREHTWARFDLTVYPPAARAHNQRVLADCQDFAAAVVAGQGGDNLLLLGEVGRGKTFLATAVANHVLQHRRTATYFTFPEFVQYCRRRALEGPEGADASLERLLAADLLVLDDLGAEKVSEFVIQELFNVLNTRINHQRPFVISTNLNYSQLAEVYTGRVASRVFGTARVHQLEGDDVRLVLRFRAQGESLW